MGSVFSAATSGKAPQGPAVETVHVEPCEQSKFSTPLTVFVKFGNNSASSVRANSSLGHNESLAAGDASCVSWKVTFEADVAHLQAMHSLSNTAENTPGEAKTALRISGISLQSIEDKYTKDVLANISALHIIGKAGNETIADISLVVDVSIADDGVLQKRIYGALPGPVCTNSALREAGLEVSAR